MNDKDWTVLTKRIKRGKCTPFLGAGVNEKALPLGSEIATAWAKEHGYPLTDSYDLARVAQFLAVEFEDFVHPKELIIEQFNKQKPADYPRPDSPVSILAGLPLPIFMTTNYDDFLMKALVELGKHPTRELCRWNAATRDKESIFDRDREVFTPTIDHPVVYHLHGHDEIPESLVLHEDDYLEFLVAFAKRDNLTNQSRLGALIPPVIKQAITGTSLLFVGYGLRDWSFRVVFQGMIDSYERVLHRKSIAVQLPPDDEQVDREKAEKYLNDYFESMRVSVFWGTAKEFLAELQQRLQAS